jgi:GH43 family beta-xylosidase
MLLALLMLFLLEGFAEPFTNPLKAQTGSDPWMTYHDGYYYLLTTGWTEVAIKRAKNLSGLKTGESKVIYKSNGGDRCCNVWAPGNLLLC